MEDIKVNRLVLLDALRENRSKHETDFDAALKVWLKKATKALAKAAKTAEDDGKIIEMPLAKLPKPTRYLDSYDDAIARVEMDVREEIVLDDRTFSAWVQDNWTWRGAFTANTSFYNG